MVLLKSNDFLKQKKWLKKRNFLKHTQNNSRLEWSSDASNVSVCDVKRSHQFGSGGLSFFVQFHSI